MSDRQPPADALARIAGSGRTRMYVFAYVLAASLWILVSDRVLRIAVPSPGAAEALASAKGIGFVLLSALLLMLLLRRLSRAAEAQAAADAELRRDVTRMRAMFADIVESSADAIYAKDRDGRYLVMNRAAERVLGLARGEALGAPDDKLFPAQQAARLRARAREIFENRTLQTFDDPVVVDGEPRLFLTTAGPLRDAQGQVIGSFGISRDVTEQRRSAARLELTATAFEMAGLGISISDAATNRLLEVNPAFAECRGRGRDDFIGLPIAQLFPPELAQQMQAAQAQVDVRDHLVFESENLRADGSRFPVRFDITLLRDEQGRPLHRIAFSQDLSAKRRAERELALSAKAFEMAELPASIADARSNTTLDVNAAFARLSGYEREELIGRDIFVLSPQGQRGRVRTLLDRVDRADHLGFETEFMRKDGSVFPALVDLTVTHDDSGQAVHRIAYVFDLSQRKQTERALAESAQRYRNLYEHSPDAVFVCERDRVLMANRAALTLLGACDREQVIGHALGEFLADGQALAMATRLGSDQNDGDEVAVQQQRARRVDGAELDVEFVASAFDDAGHRLLHVILRDLSERRALEREVIEISTAEQARIGREIHDGVCQQLAAASLMIAALRRRSPGADSEQPWMRTLQQVDAQLGQALVQARAIANGSAPVHADAQSLEHALRAMVQSADATPGVACRIVYAARDLQLEQVAATHVYRIAQEAVANALKHSRATRIELELRAHGRSFVLSVRDDGIGLPATAPRWGQLGLSIMRYRAHLIGATLSLLRAPGGGTDIRCERVAAED